MKVSIILVMVFLICSLFGAALTSLNSQLADHRNSTPIQQNRTGILTAGDLGAVEIPEYASETRDASLVSDN